MATSLRRRGGTERARAATALTTAPSRTNRHALLTAAVVGVVVRVGDTVYDGSLSARIRQMKEKMLPN